jgi:hypothetical protein
VKTTRCEDHVGRLLPGPDETGPACNLPDPPVRSPRWGLSSPPAVMAHAISVGSPRRLAPLPTIGAVDDHTKLRVAPQGTSQGTSQGPPQGTSQGDSAAAPQMLPRPDPVRYPTAATCARSPLGTFAECPLCGGTMAPEHAHERCTSCGWRDSCCD